MEKVLWEKAKGEYNTLMFDYCLEFLTIGTNFSEGTENWNLRDLVSECQYQLEVCYEDGNANSEGRYPDYWEIDSECLLSHSKYRYVISHNESEKEMHEYWLRKTRRLRNFIRKYKKYIEDMNCNEGHCSQFD